MDGDAHALGQRPRREHRRAVQATGNPLPGAVDVVERQEFRGRRHVVILDAAPTTGLRRRAVTHL